MDIKDLIESGQWKIIDKNTGNTWLQGSIKDLMFYFDVLEPDEIVIKGNIMREGFPLTACEVRSWP